jgi:glycosyltransferase involved in cell wall biosynthesis
MLAKWIADDPRSEHRVVVTRQGWQPIPDKVARLLGHRPKLLDGRYRSQLARAAALRRLCRNADVVVVHAHPDDIQPALALATVTKPCIVVNHASHVFWAGTSIARTTLHLRRSAQELTVSRRGLPADSGFVVNRPLAFPKVDVRREDARAAFAIADDQIVVATAASASKYEPLDDGDDLVQLLVGLVDRHPQLVVLAAGPRPEGRWLAAEQATGGRLRAMGPLPDVGGLLAAADIYVDSFPFASITSLLEAGAHGIPVVSYRGHGPGCDVLSADPPAIDDDILSPETPDEFAEAVSALVADGQARESRGAILREKIAATHSGAAWQDVVESLYAFAERPGGAEGAVCVDDVGPRSTALDFTVRCIQHRTGQSQGIDAVCHATLASMPAKARLRTWRRLKKSGLALGLSELLRDVDRVRAQKAMVAILRRTRPQWVRAHLG